MLRIRRGDRLSMTAALKHLHWLPVKCLFLCSAPFTTERVILFPINAPDMGRFQLLNLAGLGYGLELRFWVVIAIIVSLTLTITLITTLTII